MTDTRQDESKRMKITVLSQVDPTALERLAQHHEVVDGFGQPQEKVAELTADADVVVLRSGVQLTRPVLEGASRLKLILRAGSGFDNIDVEAARELGVVVARIPGPASRAVAELVLGLMLATARNLLPADASMRRAEWKKAELGGNLLRNKVAGVVGLGNIGSVVAELCQNVGMKVVGVVENPTEMRVKRFAAKDIELMDLEDVARVADFLTLHVPLDDTTFHMIDARILGLMKKGSFLFNTSRGGVVDEHALIEALDRGDGVKGAALDTHENEGAGKLSYLAGHHNVVLTPHIGSMAVETQAEIGERIVELVTSLERGEIENLLTERERVA